ncbi:MAG: capsule biosynthesis protein CapA [Flammeovirgaceae bacterium]|nr:capsule biosynthesis protein CapA [Flammeovirgaceae bacterium]
MLFDFIKPIWILAILITPYLNLPIHYLLASNSPESRIIIKHDELDNDHLKETFPRPSDLHLKDTSKSFSLTAVGDIMMGTNFPSKNYLPPDSGNTLWAEAGPVLRSSNVTFGNLEGVILSEGGEMKECQNPKNCYLFRTPEDLSFQFKNNGFNLLSTANNHANDFGETGRQNTQKVLDSLEIGHAGSIEKAYHLLYINELTIGFAAFAPNKGTQLIADMDEALHLVKILDSLSDVIVISFHGGAEGALHQHVTRETEFYYGEDRGNVYNFSHSLIDAGADVLIGHGPHVVRGIEVYKDRIIAYSLGNFLTYGRFNLKGINALAPLLDLNIGYDGRFISGQIHSFIQNYSVGPRIDKENKAALQIKKLSESDFPKNPISIDAFGGINYLNKKID